MDIKYGKGKQSLPVKYVTAIYSIHNEGSRIKLRDVYFSAFRCFVWLSSFFSLQCVANARNSKAAFTWEAVLFNIHTYTSTAQALITTYGYVLKLAIMS